MPNGVDIQRFSPPDKSKAELKKELDLDPDAFLAVYTGRLVKRKGLDVLLKAWSFFVKSCSNSMLYIIGSGDFQVSSIESESRQFVEKNELTKHVRFLGLRRDVEVFLKCADLFVFPARPEGEGCRLTRCQQPMADG